jgi:O-antigen ligase
MKYTVSPQTRVAAALVPQSADYNRDAEAGRKTTEIWKIAIIIIAMMPLVQTIVTWDADGQFTLLAHYIRQYSLPTTILELTLLAICTSTGWRPHKQFFGLSRATQSLIVATVFLILISSLAASESPMVSTLFALRYAAHILLIGALVHIFSVAETDQDIEYWVWAIFFGGLIYVAALSYFAIFVPKPVDFRWSECMPSATNIRQIGNVVSLLALAPVALLLFEKNSLKTVLAWIGLTCLLTFLMWTGSRGALISLCVATGFAAWRARTAIKVNRALFFVSATVIALITSVLIPVPDSSFGLVRMAESVSSSDLSSGRVQVWQHSVSAILDSPVLGHGAGTYRQNMVSINGVSLNHPHNFILQFVYDWGLLGGGFMLASLAIFGVELLSSPVGRADARFLASSAFVTLVSGAMIDGPLFYPLPIIIAIAMMSPQISLWSGKRLGGVNPRQ